MSVWPDRDAGHVENNTTHFWTQFIGLMVNFDFKTGEFSN